MPTFLTRKNFEHIPDDFPDPATYYSDGTGEPVFYEWIYLKDVNKWFKKLKEAEEA